MTNGISGNLGPKNVDNNNNNANNAPEVRDITEEIRLKSVFEKEHGTPGSNRGVAPDGKKIAAEAKKKYGGYPKLDTDYTRGAREIVVNHRNINNPRSIFGGK